MGGTSSRAASRSKQIIWCDTEGGVRGVNLWDVAFIVENDLGTTAQRFVSPSDATKRGKAHLCKQLRPALYVDALRTGNTCVIQYNLTDGKWDAYSHMVVEQKLPALVKAYLANKGGSSLIAWNMNGHDRHVLRRAVGQDTLSKVCLWDALPWFRSRYSLPKNTMSSSRPGTPRAVFNVQDLGTVHTSLADAAHMREVVLRAAYCCAQPGAVDTGCYRNASRLDMLKCVQDEVGNKLSSDEWTVTTAAVCGTWTPGKIPKSVYKAVPAHT